MHQVKHDPEKWPFIAAECQEEIEDIFVEAAEQGKRMGYLPIQRRIEFLMIGLNAQILVNTLKYITNVYASRWLRRIFLRSTIPITWINAWLVKRERTGVHHKKPKLVLT